MSTLIVVPYFLPDTGPIPSMYGALAEDVTASGRDVVVVTAQPNYGVSVRRRFRLYDVEVRERQRIVRVFVPRLNRASLLSRLNVLLCFNILASLYVMFARNLDRALLTNPAFEVLLVALVVRIRKIPFHYRVHDLYPEIAIRLKLIRPQGAIAWFIHRLEHMLLSWSTTISVVTPAFKRHLDRQGVLSTKIVIVPDWADTEAIEPGPKNNEFSRKHNLVDKFVVAYGGNIGRSQGLEVFLDAAAILQDQEQIVFLLIGDGASKLDLIARSRTLRLKNVIFLPYQPQATLGDVYATWDVGFVSLAPGVSPEWCTGKVYTIMASARPVLAAVDAGGEVDQLIARSRCGRCTDAGDPVVLADAIRSLFTNRADLHAAGLRGRQIVECQYSRAVCTKQLIELIEQLDRPGSSVTPMARSSAVVG